jgi:hypothetical protein
LLNDSREKGDVEMSYVTHADTHGDGINPDNARIQEAINKTRVGGTVWLPSGRKHLIEPPGIVLSDSKKLWGNGSMFELTQPNMNGVTITGNNCKLSDLLIANPNFSSSDSANIILSNCLETVLEDIRSVGGFYGLKFRACSDNRIEGGKFDSTYGPCVMHSANANPGFLRRIKFDTQWPVLIPKDHNFLGSWQAGKHYNLGDVVTLTGIYQMQCSLSGSSGLVQPNIKPYYESIQDGGCQWLFVNMVGSAAIILDSNTGGPSVDSCDLTGCYTWGTILQNTLGGNGPQLATFRNNEFGQAIYGGVKIVDGAGTRLFGNVMDAGCRSFSAGVNIEGGSDAMIYANTIYGFGYGITANGGSNTTLQGNRIMGYSYRPIYIADGVNVHDSGNVTSHSDVWG